METHILEYESPIGVIEITGTEAAITSIIFTEGKKQHGLQANTPAVLADCYYELDEYFKGTRKEFTFPYHYAGTDFQNSVWKALCSIPYAKTGSYRDIAVSIGNEKAVRAVGAANGKNPISIAVPCHRVIGANGKLTGYGGGLWRKEWLLAHEKKHA